MEADTMNAVAPIEIAQPREAARSASDREIVFETRGLTISYGKSPAVSNVNLAIYRNLVTAIIGPSGCGKSTFLRSLNRMNDLVPSAKVEGEVLYHGQNIYGDGVENVSITGPGTLDGNGRSYIDKALPEIYIMKKGRPRTLVSQSATGYYGPVYTSQDAGATWRSNSLPAGNWSAITSSADGNMLAVTVFAGSIKVSRAALHDQGSEGHENRK